MTFSEICKEVVQHMQKRHTYFLLDGKIQTSRTAHSLVQTCEIHLPLFGLPNRRVAFIEQRRDASEAWAKLINLDISIFHVMVDGYYLGVVLDGAYVDLQDENLPAIKDDLVSKAMA